MALREPRQRTLGAQRRGRGAFSTLAPVMIAPERNNSAAPTATLSKA
jgi:hypothetical protein